MRKRTNLEYKSYFDEGWDRWVGAYTGTKIPDRVPIYAQLHEYAMINSNWTGGEFYTDAEKLINAEVENAYELGFDIPDITHDCYNIEAEALGGEVEFNDSRAPELVRRPVTEKSDLLSLPSPDPFKDGRMPFVLEIIKGFEEKMNRFPRINITAPFTLAAKLRGVQQLLIDLVRDEEFVRDLLAFVVEEVLAPYLDAMLEVRSYRGEIIAADAIASPPNLDLPRLEEFALNPLLKLKKKCGEDLVLLNWWGERSVQEPEKLLELKLRASSGRVVEGQDPDVSEVGPDLFSNFASERDLTLILGVGPETMMFGSPGEVERRVKKYLAAGKALKGQFLLYITNLVTDTPRKNITAAVDSVSKYGKYKK